MLLQEKFLYKSVGYHVILFDDQVSLLRGRNEYAMGVWCVSGGYVIWKGDTAKSRFNYRVFDKVDSILRLLTKFIPSHKEWEDPLLRPSSIRSHTFYVEDDGA